MDLEKAIRTRFSARSYEYKEVDEEKLRFCLEMARLSPSATNAQPYKIIAVNDLILAKKVGEATQTPGLPLNKFTRNVPCFIVIISEQNKIANKIKELAKIDFTPYDIGILVENFCLAATSVGLDTCIIGWFNQKKIQSLLNIPKSRQVKMLISVGNASADYKERKKKEFDELISFNKY